MVSWPLTTSDSQRSQSDQLCRACRDVDFGRLTSWKHSREEVAKVRIDHLKVFEARQNHDCPVCRLVTRCAALAGLDSNLNAAVSLKQVQTWSAEPGGPRQQIRIEYATLRLDIKKVKRRPNVANQAGQHSGPADDGRGPGKRRRSGEQGATAAADYSKDVVATDGAAGDAVDDTLAGQNEVEEGSLQMQQAIAASLLGAADPAVSSISGNLNQENKAKGRHDPGDRSSSMQSDPAESDDDEDEDLQRAVARSFQNPAKVDAESAGSETQIETPEKSDLFAAMSNAPAWLTQFHDTREAWDRIVQASWLVDITNPRHHGTSGFIRQPVTRVLNHNMIRWWQTCCDRIHHHPTQVAGVTVPLSELPLQRFLRAINTTTGEVSSLDPNDKFAALSYVWGSHIATLDWGPTKPTPDEGVIPPTIRNAMGVAKLLKYDWLWVDRICIKQDDSNEKAVLMAYMKDIFAAADLTLVAAAGDVTTGLLGASGSPQQRQDEILYDVPLDSELLRLAPESVSFNAKLLESPWHRRGWPFEEHVFSRRLLYFFQDEIFFTCSKMTVRERAGSTFKDGFAGSTWGDRGKTPPFFGAQLHEKLHSTDPASDKIFTPKEFLGAVREYSSRELTLEEDRINAFAGIIAAASRDQDIAIPDGLLLHGHPIHIFETLLTWHHEEGAVKRLATSSLPFAPSWSWASAGTQVHFLDDGEEHTRNRWFQFDQIDGFDIVGIPQRHHIPIVSSLQLAFPYDKITEQPWLGARSEDQQASSQRLPLLHMVTVVFEGFIAPAREFQHSLRPLDGDPTDGYHVIGPWSVSDEFSKIQPTTGSWRRMTFALVGGYQHMYIMLLGPRGEGTSTFSRLGLFRLDLGSFDLRRMTTIAEKGGARWEYIKIV